MLRSPRSFPGNVQKNNRNTGWVSTLNRGEGVDPFIYSIIVSVSKQFPSCVAAREGALSGHGARESARALPRGVPGKGPFPRAHERRLCPARRAQRGEAEACCGPQQGAVGGVLCFSSKARFGCNVRCAVSSLQRPFWRFVGHMKARLGLLGCFSWNSRLGSNARCGASAGKRPLWCFVGHKKARWAFLAVCVRGDAFAKNM